VNYLVLTSPDRILRLRNMTLAFYEKLFARQEEDSVPFCWAYSPAARTLEYLRESLPKVEHAYEKMKKGKDILFYHAPVVILAHAESGFELSLQLRRCFI